MKGLSMRNIQDSDLVGRSPSVVGADVIDESILIDLPGALRGEDHEISMTADLKP